MNVADKSGPLEGESSFLQNDQPYYIINSRTGHCFGRLNVMIDPAHYYTFVLPSLFK